MRRAKKKNYYVFFILLLLVFGTSTFAKSSEVSIWDFEIVSYEVRWDVDGYHVTGEIKNMGNALAGVQVVIVARDSEGALVDSVNFWPNGTNNILPGSSTGIGQYVTKEARAKNFEIQILSAKVW